MVPAVLRRQHPFVVLFVTHTASIEKVKMVCQTLVSRWSRCGGFHDSSPLGSISTLVIFGLTRNLGNTPLVLHLTMRRYLARSRDGRGRRQPVLPFLTSGPESRVECSSDKPSFDSGDRRPA